MAQPTSTKTLTKQEINLRDYLGRSPTQAEKDRFIELAIERMIERTQAGIDVNGDTFKEYTEAYARSKGVSTSEVDLTLFGDMLLSIEGDDTRDKVILKIEDDNEAIKAYAHIKGFPGHPHIKDGPKRNFFGLTDTEAESIAGVVASGAEPEPLITESFIEELIRNLTIEVEDDAN